MELFEKDYVLGFWIGHNETSDFLMTVLKRDDKWLCEYRFRYHRDSKVFDSKDKKSFYNFSTDGKKTEKQILKEIALITEVIAIQYPNIEYHEVRGDADKLLYTLAQHPSSHVKTIPNPEKK